MPSATSRRDRSVDGLFLTGQSLTCSNVKAVFLFSAGRPYKRTKAPRETGVATKVRVLTKLDPTRRRLKHYVKSGTPAV